MENAEGTGGAEPDAGFRPSVQPHVSQRDLSEFETSPEANNLARLEADQALLFSVSTEGFEGPAWREVARALAEYGFAVMRAWIRSGVVFQQLRRKGISGKTLTTPPDGISAHDAAELAHDSVADGIIHFRDHVLKAGVWDPSRGASIATFFIGDCLLRFPNLYRTWRRHRQELEIAFPEDLSPRDSDPAIEVIGREGVVDLMTRLDERSRRIVLMRARGYSVREIAALTATTTKSVEGRLYRVRHRLQERAT